MLKVKMAVRGRDEAVVRGTPTVFAEVTQRDRSMNADLKELDNGEEEGTTTGTYK